MSTDAQGERSRRPSWARVPVVAVVDLAALVLMVVAVSLRSGGGPERPGTALLLFTVLQWLPLLARNRWPLWVLVLTTVASAAQLLVVPVLDPDWDAGASMAAYQPVPIAVALAAFTVALRAPRSVERLTGAAAAVVLPLVAWAASGADHPWTLLVMCNLVLDGTAAGALVSGRRDRLAREAQEQEERTRREVEAERLRIARELHDVLAHHLTLVNAQAGVADYLVRSDPEAAARALEGMARHTRQALDELRATVGLLRERTDVPGEVEPVEPHAPTRPPLPTLERLPQLVEAVRAAGADLEVQTLGRPGRLSPGADLAAYRIVQESLTNATKHAPGAPVRLDLDWEEGWLRIRVENSVAPAATTGTGRRGHEGPGHGLLGMSERVRAAGGDLRIENPDGDGSGSFVVTATVPTDPAEGGGA